MNPEAVEQARERLRKAERSLEALKNATDFDAADDAWRDFLLAVSGIYSKLEQGSKGNGKSTGWFGRIKHERKVDPLLKYLHFARNSDEHGLERVTSRKEGSTYLGPVPPFQKRVPLRVTKIDPSTKEHIGPTFDAHVPGPHLAVTRAIDTRYGDWADSPKEHRGRPINQWNDPREVGEAVMPYLHEMIEAAAGFC